ncbi:MAG: diacylglycerol kinase family protein [Odoribacter splanchnicus]
MASEKKFSFKARLHSFKYAFRGVFLLFRYEHNAWIHLIAIVCAVMAGIILSLISLEWVVILFAIGSVCRSRQTRRLKLADFISSHRILIGKAKDLAAAAVLTVTVFIIGGIIFIPANH